MSKHTTECRRTFEEYERKRSDYAALHPKHCRHCHGWGGFRSTYDPSPAGVSLSHGTMEDFDLCDECEGADPPICAVCATPMVENEGLGEWERACKCPYDRGEPPEPECACFWVFHD